MCGVKEPWLVGDSNSNEGVCVCVGGGGTVLCEGSITIIYCIYIYILFVCLFF